MQHFDSQLHSHCEIIRFIGFCNVYIVHYNSFTFLHCVFEVRALALSHTHTFQNDFMSHLFTAEKPGGYVRMRKRYTGKEINEVAALCVLV